MVRSNALQFILCNKSKCLFAQNDCNITYCHHRFANACFHAFKTLYSINRSCQFGWIIDKHKNKIRCKNWMVMMRKWRQQIKYAGSYMMREAKQRVKISLIELQCVFFFDFSIGWKHLLRDIYQCMWVRARARLRLTKCVSHTQYVYLISSGLWMGFPFTELHSPECQCTWTPLSLASATSSFHHVAHHFSLSSLSLKRKRGKQESSCDAIRFWSREESTLSYSPAAASFRLEIWLLSAFDISCCWWWWFCWNDPDKRNSLAHHHSTTFWLVCVYFFYAQPN